MSKQARATVQVDNDLIRVTEWRFAPDEATGWYRHGYDYVVVPMTVGPLRIKSAQARCPTTSCRASHTSGWAAPSTTCATRRATRWYSWKSS
jgi:hypothetical protein